LGLNSFDMKDSRFVLPAVIVVAALSFFVLQYYEQARLMRDVSSATTRGGAWLLAYAEPLTDAGIPWAMNTMNEKYCANNSKISTEIKKRFVPFLSNPVEQAYSRLLDKREVHTIDYTLLTDRKMVFDDILVPALYCDITPVPASVLERIYAGGNTSGYTLLHSYLALLLMRENGCGTEADLEIEKSMAERIAQEQTQSKFDDKYAERVAFLEYGDRPYLVKPSWIREIVSHQDAGGGWMAGEGSYLGTKVNPHTTVLAVWALAAYSKTCPFENDGS